MKIRRTKVLLTMRSATESGRAASPVCAAKRGPVSNSGRMGGSLRRPSSAMMHRPLFFDALGEEHGVDALLQGHELGPALLRMVELMRVQFGFDLTRMRRHHQDPRA